MSLLQANPYFAFGAVFSLPRASAVKMPSAAKAAQTSRAMWKLLTNVFDDKSVPAAAPPKAAKTVPVRATLILCPMTRPVTSNRDASL